MAVVWSPTAVEQFADLLISLGEHSGDPSLPGRLSQSLKKYLSKIEPLPLNHKHADGFPDGVFETSCSPFIVCYERKDGNLEVVLVYHEKSNQYK